MSLYILPYFYILSQNKVFVFVCSLCINTFLSKHYLAHHKKVYQVFDVEKIIDCLMMSDANICYSEYLIYLKWLYPLFVSAQVLLLFLAISSDF